jgi:hypothetical protein
MAAPKKMVDPIIDLENQIAKLKLALLKAREKKASDAEKNLVLATKNADKSKEALTKANRNLPQPLLLAK